MSEMLVRQVIGRKILDISMENIYISIAFTKADRIINTTSLHFGKCFRNFNVFLDVVCISVYKLFCFIICV